MKGRDIDPATYGRVAQLVAARGPAEDRPSVVVDGGIRPHTVPRLAQAGADGVVPGSLVFADPDPMRAVTEIRALRPGCAPTALSQFWDPAGQVGET